MPHPNIFYFRFNSADYFSVQERLEMSTKQEDEMRSKMDALGIPLDTSEKPWDETQNQMHAMLRSGGDPALKR